VARLDPRTHRLTAPVQVNEQLVGTGRFPHWSPDGENLVFQTRDPMDKSPAFAEILSIRSLTTGKERRIKPEVAGIHLGVRWSPDGKSFLGWGWDKKGPRGIYRFDAQTGTAESIVRSGDGVSVYLPSWLPDGKAILYRRSDETTKTDSVVRRDLGSGEEKTAVRVESPLWIPSHAVSPDGRMLAFVVGEENGRTTSLKTVPLAGGAEREIVTLAAPEGFGGPRGLAWTRDGRFLLFVHSRGTGPGTWKSELRRVPAEGGQPEPTGLSWPDLIPGISLHPDGERIAFSAKSPNAKGEIWVMENFLPEAVAAK